MQESFGVQIKLYSQHNEVHDIKAFYAEKFSFFIFYGHDSNVP